MIVRSEKHLNERSQETLGASVNPSLKSQIEPEDYSNKEFKVWTEVKRLKPGDCFGEMALLYQGSKSKYQIQCATDCVFAVFNQKLYTKFIKNANDYARDETVEFLKKEPLFALWSKSNLIKLLESITIKKFYKEKVVCHEDQESKYFYFIKDGEFELSRQIVKDQFNKLR